MATDNGQWLRVLLEEATTTDATPTVIYTSAIDIPELRVLEITVTSLVRTANNSAVASIYKRGMFTRPSGGNLRLVTTEKTDFIGELIASDVDLQFGVAAQRFTISARGKAATTYIWSTHLSVIRNNS